VCVFRLDLFLSDDRICFEAIKNKIGEKENRNDRLCVKGEKTFFLLLFFSREYIIYVTRKKPTKK
jgi:hypothetical protein